MSKDSQTMEVKWIRIYPGLGKTQYAIKNILEDEGKIWEWIPIENLTAKVYYPDLRGDAKWMWEDYPVTRSQTNTVHRAVKSLEKIGLVKTMKSPVWTRVGFRNMTVVGNPSEGEIVILRKKPNRKKKD